MDRRKVARLFAALVRELNRRDRPRTEPVSVAELCQDVIPYAAVRSALGFELNADYEHTLLGLLAGVGGHVRLEPEEARDALRAELEGPYPDVGLFRRFASARVHLGPVPSPRPLDGLAPVGHAPGDGAPSGPGHSTGSSLQPTAPSPPAPPPVSHAPPRPSAPATRPAAPRPPSPRTGSLAAERAEIRLHRESPEQPSRSASPGQGAAPEARPGAGAPRDAGDTQGCSFCSEPLPAGRRVRFCPFCGGDQRLRPCPRCEAVLERGWRYCIRCGVSLADRS